MDANIQLPENHRNYCCIEMFYFSYLLKIREQTVRKLSGRKMCDGWIISMHVHLFRENRTRLLVSGRKSSFQIVVKLFYFKIKVPDFRGRRSLKFTAGWQE